MSSVSDLSHFRMMPDMLNLAFFGRLSVLASMGMMGAASENRMQQHRRHCQNAGQIAEHWGVHRAGDDKSKETFSKVLRTFCHRHKPDYHLNAKLPKVESGAPSRSTLL
jgi:hypothetical protein